MAPTYSRGTQPEAIDLDGWGMDVFVAFRDREIARRCWEAIRDLSVAAGDEDSWSMKGKGCRAMSGCHSRLGGFPCKAIGTLMPLHCQVDVLAS
jgi:hypothetical protein